jgi:TolB-like protein
MTQLDVMYRYGTPPSEAATMALGRVREVYGIRRVTFDEAAKTVRIEYDATRLTEPIVHQLLRRSGLDVVERVSLIPPQPVAEAAAEPAVAKA